MKAIFDSLHVIEEQRDQLHAALREALFKLSEARRVEEHKGCLVDFAAVPSEPNSVTPSSLLEAEQVEVESDTPDEAAVHWHLVTVEAVAARPCVLDARSSNSSSKGLDSSSGVSTTAPEDPLYMFSRMPSQPLKECQQLFRDALALCVAVSAAQQRALALAENKEKA